MTIEEPEGCWYDQQGCCTVHDHTDNDLPEPPNENRWEDHKERNR